MTHCDDVSFLQISVLSAPELKYPLVGHNSATFPSLVYTNLHAAAAGRSLQPLAGPLNEDWMVLARRAFVECASVEFQDEGPVQYWTTWFVHYARYPSNSESRTLRLDVHRHRWFQDLCKLWADAMDPTQSAPFTLFIRHTQHIGHLILVQGHGPEIPVLMTALFDLPTQPSMICLGSEMVFHTEMFVPLWRHPWACSPDGAATARGKHCCDCFGPAASHRW